MPPGLYEEPDWGPVLVRFEGERFEILSVDSSPARNVIDVFRITGTLGGDCRFEDPEEGTTEPCELRPGPSHFDLVLEGESSRFRRLPESGQPAAAASSAAAASAPAAAAASAPAAPAASSAPAAPAPGAERAAEPPPAPAAPIQTAETSTAELQPGQRYTAGTRVSAREFGVSFVLPAEWAGGLPPGEEAMILGSESRPGLGLVYAQIGVSAAEVASVLSEPQELGQGVVLQPAGAPKVEGRRVSAHFAGGAYVGRALALVGPAGNAVGFVFLGPKEQDSYYTALLEGLAVSTRLETPKPPPTPVPRPKPAGAAGEWTEFVANMQLTRLWSYYSGGGGDGSYVGGSSESNLHLCADGRYLFGRKSSMSVDAGVDGPSVAGYSAGRGQEVGRWRIQQATQARAVLVLEAEDGSIGRHALTWDGKKTYLDGERAFRVRSEACP